jgi:hypothetical protein
MWPRLVIQVLSYVLLVAKVYGTPCQAGSYQASSGLLQNFICVECLVNYFCRGCDVNPLIEFDYECATNTSSFATPCPVNMPTNLSGSSSCFPPKGSNQCHGGTYYNTTTQECTYCPLGHSCAGGLSSPKECNVLVGEYSDTTGAWNCKRTLGGYAPNGSSAYKLCPRDTYAGKGASECLTCIGAGAGLLSCDQNDTQTCLIGERNDNGCVPCEKNTFSDVNTRLRQCKACPVGSHTNDHMGQTACRFCDEGYGMILGFCVRCRGGYNAPPMNLEQENPIGLFYPLPLPECFRCADGWYAPAGSIECTRCFGAVSLDRSQCLVCKFPAFIDGTSCNCPAHQILSYDLVSCHPCTRGAYCIPKLVYL